MSAQSSARPRNILITIVVALCITAIVCWAVYRMQTLDHVHQESCRNNLKKIVIALHAYQSEYRALPPAYIQNRHGKRLHSWRVLLLPFLGHDELYKEYQMDEPWDGPHNRKLALRIPDIYRCPANGMSATSTSYVAIVGSLTGWPEHYSTTFGEITDGLANTIAIAETKDLDINWMEPRDITYEQAAAGINPESVAGISSLHKKDGRRGANIAMFDKSAHFFYNEVERGVLRSLLSARGGQVYADLPPPNVSFVQLGDVVDASKLKNTEVLPHLGVRHRPGQNQLYCSTFQIAWDKAKTEFKTDAIKLEGSPEMAHELNQRQFDTANLDGNSYVAVAGIATDEYIGNLKSELASKFPGKQLRAPEPDPDLLIAYAYLQKTLPFRTPFSSYAKPVRFEFLSGAMPVACFGFEELDPSRHRAYSQVRVLDYISDDDFVIQLGTRTDVIVLAKVKPKATFERTLIDVQTRVRSGPAKRSGLEKGETLAVPKMQLNVRRDYAEILNKKLVDHPQWTVGQASQIIRFLLDETGASLESESVFLPAKNGHGEKKEENVPRRFVLDRPFLLYLQQHRASEPYFVMWVGNSQLLEKVSE